MAIITKDNSIGIGLGGGTVDETTDGRIPVKSGVSFVDSPARVVDEITIFDTAIETPPGSVIIGQGMDLSAAGGLAIFRSKLTGNTYSAIYSKYDDTGTELPFYVQFDSETFLEIQSVFSTSTPLTGTFSNTATATEMINELIFKTDASATLTNVRLNFVSQSTGESIYYYPSRIGWEQDEGTDLVADGSGNVTLDIREAPILALEGVVVDISYKIDSGNLLGNGTVPYNAITRQTGTLTDIADALTIADAERVQTTGILSGGLISQASSTTVDWTAGNGVITDYSDPNNPVVHRVSWDAETGYTPTNLTTDCTTVFGYDKNGAIVEILTSALAPIDTKDYILIGAATHTGSTIVSINTSPGNIGYDGTGSFMDFFNLVIGPANISGNTYQPNGVNMNIDVIGGEAYMVGANFHNDPQLSDIVTLPTQFPVSFSKVYRDADPGLYIKYDGSPTTIIDPTQLDDGSGTLQSVTAGYWTIQRIFRSRDGSTYVAYGQDEFATKDLAVEAVSNELFEEKSPLPFALMRGYLVVSQAATDLSDTNDAVFFEASNFRSQGIYGSSAAIPGITSPGGSDTNIQFNDGGNFGGDTNFVFDNATTRIGVGTSTPASTAHIYENTSLTDLTTGITVENAGTGDATLRFIADGQTVTMGIDNSATNTFKLAMGVSYTSNVAITIDSLENIITGGNVGINKTPVSAHVLDIKTFASETVRLRDDKGVTFEAGNTSTYSTDFYLNRSGVGTNQSEFLITNVEDNFFADRYTRMSFTDNTGGLTIRQTNDVGIGIDAPASTLHVYENTTDTSASTGLTVENAGTGDALIQLAAGDKRWLIRNDNSNNDRLIIGDSSDFARIVFDTVEKIRVDNKLIVGDTSTTGVELTEAASTNYITGQTNPLIVATDAASDLTLQTDSTDAIIIDGTTQDVQIVNNVTIDGTLYPNNVVGYIKNGETGFAERHISTGSFIDTTISLTATGTIYGAWFGKEGTRLYVTTNAAYIYQYNLTVPYDITTATFTASNNFTDPNNTNGYTLWNDDGTVFWHGGRGSRKITLTTPWEISGIALDQGPISTSFRNPFEIYDLRWNFDGTKVLGVGDSLDQAQRQSFIEWECTTPYDFGTKTAQDANIIPFPTGIPTGANVVKGFDISPDGKRVYLSASSLGTEYEVVLETAWDLSSSTLVDTITRGAHSDIVNYSMIPDASGMVSVTPAGLIVQKKYGLSVDGQRVTTEADNLNTNTGILEGGILSINSGDNTLVDVTAGTARICDYTDPLNPTHTNISWDAQTIDPTLDTYWNKWIGVQESSTPGVAEFVFSVEFSQLEKRSIAIVGRAWGIVATGVVVGVGDYAVPAFDQGNFGQDLSYSLGSFNKVGNVYSPNGSNLLLNKSAGSSFRFGANWSTSPLSPHVITDASQTGISSYYYHLQGATSSDIQTDIDPDNWDSAGSKTSVPSGYYTLQRLYYFPVSQVLSVTYGQRLFSSMAEAISYAGKDDVTITQSLLEGAILRGWIAIKQGATSLADTAQAQFIEARSISEPGAKRQVGTTKESRSYSFSDYGSDLNSFLGGFYIAPAAAATITIGGTASITHGSAGIAYAAHAFAVFAGGSGSASAVLTVSGTSIDEDGNLTTSDSEIIFSGTTTLNEYYETTKKWLGTVTYTITGTSGSYTFNYGFAKYDDFGNVDFTVTNFEMTGRSSVAASNTDIILYHHIPTGFTYSAASFNPYPDKICSMIDDYSSSYSGLDNEGYFAYKRTNLSQIVYGSGSEGIVILFKQSTNSAVRYGTATVTVLI